MPAEPVAVLAVGDIASCASEFDEAVAGLVAQREGQILALGDVVYERGTEDEFDRCLEPSWGRFKSRLRPSPGNHEYHTDDGAPFHEYFDVPKFYAFDVGSWRAISLNSNCEVVDCGRGSEQYEWLRDELDEHEQKCTLAYFHHPRFSSGLHGSTEAMAPLYALLWEANVDIVLAGHDHHYERFAPLDPRGAIDTERGIRNFTVGTGGRSLYPVLRPEPGSEVHDSATYGVLALTLGDGRYDWEFVPVPPGTFNDRGSTNCH